MVVNIDQDALFITEFSTLLEKRGALKKQDAAALQQAFKKSSALSLEEFLLEEDLVSKEELIDALGAYYNLPALDVIGIFFDHHLVRMFPKDVMLRNGFIPYERDGDVLMVIAAKPNHPELAEIIGKFVSYDVTFMVGIFRDICDMVKEFYDESIEVADIELFEDTQDEHEKHPIEDALNKNNEED